MINELPNIITSRSERKQQVDGQPFGTHYRHNSGEAIIDDFFAAVSPPSLESPYSFDREWDGYKRKSSLQCFNREKNVMVGHDFTPTELDLDRYVKELSLPLMKNPNQICTQFPITPNELQQFDFDNTVKSPFDEFNTHFGMNYGSYIGSDYARSVFSAAASQGRNNRTRCRNNSYDSDTTIASNQSFPTRHSIVDNSNDDTPRAQNLKFSTDLYTPKWVRYTGTKKEGLCEMCEPGKWFQLKNSAYWYHKQFIHGISSINGQKFDRPRQSRVCWLSSQEDCFLKEIPLYVCVESYCDDCKCWVQQYKCKKRVEHTYSNIEDFKKAVIDTDVACESPMKIVATFCDGKLKCPAGILMNSKVMDEVSSSMRNDSGPQWYKHKHKCQVNCK